MRLRRGALLAVACLAVAMPAPAQDATAAYPWRLSWFPYLTASPNTGVMAMGRAIFFRQSRWEDRVSLAESVAIEGGYSTNDSWVARATGAFPQLADGWRLLANAGMESTADLFPEAGSAVRGKRQWMNGELSRTVAGPVLLALRGEAAHLSTGDRRETHLQGRLAVVADLRDREYDTRRGALLQAGFIFGRAQHRYIGANLDGSDQVSRWAPYTGGFVLASGWLPLGEATRITARAGARVLTSDADANIDPVRSVPGWEDAFVALGGPESNRGLPTGARADRKITLASAEIRHDLFRFPAGAIAILAFVDGGRSSCGCDIVTVASRATTDVAQAGASPSRGDWVVAPGGGVSVRLLRNAILTLTGARAEGKVRWYVGGGFSW